MEASKWMGHIFLGFKTFQAIDGQGFSKLSLTFSLFSSQPWREGSVYVELCLYYSHPTEYLVLTMRDTSSCQRQVWFWV